jgi:hypothetical protein
MSSAPDIGCREEYEISSKNYTKIYVRSCSIFRRKRKTQP